MPKKKEVPYNDNNLAIAYYRCSSDKQETSVKQQQEEAKRYADAHGYIIIKEFIDDGISGKTQTKKRKDFYNMLAQIEEIKPAILILWKVDRLARNDDDMYLAKTTIREAGCRIHYIAEPTQDDSPEAYLMEGMLEKFAVYYSKQLAVNVRRGQLFNRERGLYLGVKMLGYTTEGEGRHNKHYVIDPVTAPIVQRIFMLYVDGMSMQQICNQLNKEGRVTVWGRPFTINSIRNILKNEAYIGVYKYADTIIEDGMPVIIDRDLFDEAQKMLQKNKKFGSQNARGLDENNQPRFWLTGKLYCGECGDSMQGTSGRSKSGAKYYYYSCNDQHKGKRGNGCKKKPVRKEQLEEFICSQLSLFLDDTENLASLAVDLADYYTKEYDISYLDSLKADLKTTETQLNNVVNAVLGGAMGETINNKLAELEERKKALEDVIATEEVKSNVVKDSKSVQAFFDRFRYADMTDPENRDIVLGYFVDKIFVFDDRIVVTSKFDDNERSIKLSDLKELSGAGKCSTTSSLSARRIRDLSENLNLLFFYSNQPAISWRWSWENSFTYSLDFKYNKTKFQIIVTIIEKVCYNHIGDNLLT